ncbi:hypothetical protein JCM18899A_13810 [Nocardioides sp. AN3]
MNEECTTTVSDTSPICPSWCEGHETDPLDGLTTHYGQMFGEVSTVLLEEGGIGAFAPPLDDALDVDELRELSADLAAAADWIAERTR